MIQLPAVIVATYRPATAREVHSWSFGKVSVRRRPNSEFGEHHRGSLDDQSIFGPIRDFECACGRYSGKQYEMMICDRCGVKVTTSDQRRVRFGHIDLAPEVPHPCVEGMVSAMPVLPAAFVSSAGGENLAGLYERLATLDASESPTHVQACLEKIAELLVPLVTIAHDWNLQEALVLARGLALERRARTSEDDCCECGYPLTGLDERKCPVCGMRLGPS